MYGLNCVCARLHGIDDRPVEYGYPVTSLETERQTTQILSTLYDLGKLSNQHKRRNSLSYNFLVKIKCKVILPDRIELVSWHAAPHKSGHNRAPTNNTQINVDKTVREIHERKVFFYWKVVQQNSQPLPVCKYPGFLNTSLTSLVTTLSASRNNTCCSVV